MVSPTLWTLVFVVMLGSSLYAVRLHSLGLQILGGLSAFISAIYFLYGLGAISNAMRSAPHGLELNIFLIIPAIVTLAAPIREMLDGRRTVP